MTETIKPTSQEVISETPKTSFHRFARMLRSDESLSETELATLFWKMRDSIASILKLPQKSSWIEIAATMKTVLESGVATLPQLLLADNTILQEESWPSFIDGVLAYHNNLPITASPESIQNKEQVVDKIRSISLALSLRYGEEKEVLVFPGISESVFNKMKDDEEGLPEGYFTPINELVLKWSKGIKITCNQDGSNPLFSAAGEDFDFENSLPIDKLDSTKIQDSELLELLQLIQQSAKLSATN